MQDIDAKTYAAMVLVLDAHVLGEDSAVATFICTAGARVNHILNQNGHGDIKWTIHPSRRRTDQQQAEPVSAFLLPMFACPHIAPNVRAPLLRAKGTLDRKQRCCLCSLRWMHWMR